MRLDEAKYKIKIDGYIKGSEDRGSGGVGEMNERQARGQVGRGRLKKRERGESQSKLDTQIVYLHRI